MMISSYLAFCLLWIANWHVMIIKIYTTCINVMIRNKGKSVLGSSPYGTRQCGANCKALCFLVCALLHERKGMSRERTEDTNTDKHRTR